MDPVNVGTAVHLETTVYNEADVATDPTDLQLVYRKPDGTETSVLFAALTNETGTGVWSYDLTVTVAGTWAYEWRSTTPTATDAGTFEVRGSPIGGTRSQGAGPCQPWCDPNDLTEGGWTAPTGATTAVLERACGASSQACFEMGGRRWPGLCWDTVLPALVGCADAGFAVWPTGNGGSAIGPPPGYPSGFRGWQHTNLLDLGAEPVTAVEQVRELGVVLASTAYELVNGRYLVRVDGGAWASGNDPGWSPSAIAVDFTYGASPPPLGREAAVALAKQLVLSIADGDSCTLNRRVRQITRENLSIDVAVPGLIDALREGYTGVPEVDLFVAAVNPHHLGRAARVIVPGRPFPAHRG